MALFDREAQAQLERHLYPEEKIEILESVNGKSFISAGGAKFTVELLDHLHLQEDDYVLDVGCGTGGASLLMARKYKAKVLGVDLCSYMIAKAKRHLAADDLLDSISSKVGFQLMDITRKEFLPLSFDFIYCRETLMHVFRKEDLLSNFLHWLKPGGKLLLAEYCTGEKEHGGTISSLREQIPDNQYHLVCMDTLERMLAKVGFTILESKDMTMDVVSYLKEDVACTLKEKDALDNDNEQRPSKLYTDIIHDSKSRIERCLTGEQKWGFFIARKP